MNGSGCGGYWPLRSSPPSLYCLSSPTADIGREGVVMPKRKEPELDPKEQYKRFKEAAKKAGVTDSEEEFERALKKVAPRPHRQKGGQRA